jgi:large subunit ribosomal protein L5
MSKLKEKFRSEIRPGLQEALGLRNSLEVPKLDKIVVSLGVKAADKDVLKDLTADLSRITGQAPMVTRSKKSISNFKLREGIPIGAKVTLRGDRMYDFVERLAGAALPRIRDFRGLSPTGFDGRGNYSFGVEEHTIFPELDPDEVKQVRGMNITFVTSTKEDKHAHELLKRLGIPFADGN